MICINVERPRQNDEPIGQGGCLGCSDRHMCHCCMRALLRAAWVCHFWTAIKYVCLPVCQLQSVNLCFQTDICANCGLSGSAKSCVGVCATSQVWCMLWCMQGVRCESGALQLVPREHVSNGMSGRVILISQAVLQFRSTRCQKFGAEMVSLYNEFGGGGCLVLAQHYPVTSSRLWLACRQDWAARGWSN